MNGQAARVAASESGDEQVQSLAILNQKNIKRSLHFGRDDI